MKSVTIKDIKGVKLIKISKAKGIWSVESRRDLADLIVVIVDDNNQRITVPTKR